MSLYWLRPGRTLVCSLLLVTTLSLCLAPKLL